MRKTNQQSRSVYFHLLISFRSPSVGYVGPYLTTERAMPERKVSNNVEAIVDLYEKNNKEEENNSMKNLPKSTKDEKGSSIRKKKKNKKKKDDNSTKEEGLEEIRLVKVIYLSIAKRRKML